MPRQSKDTIAVLGIDIGKNTFHLIGLSKRGVIVLRQNAIRLEPDVALPRSALESILRHDRSRAIS
jgi:hypothetical protein